MPGAIRSTACRRSSTKAGYKLHDPGRYQVMNNDFTSQISAFKAAGAEIVVGNMIPPDFATFWSQAAQQGFKPKIVTIGKALLFPSVVQSLGARGDGLTSEIWWTPTFPFKSGLTGQSAKQLTDAYTKATKPAVDAADRLSACAVRGGDRRAQARQEPEGSEGDARCRSWRPTTTRWSGRCIGPASR